jgi:hemerythrin-like domain-containing protein
MEGQQHQPFEKMAEESVPKCDEPTKVSAPKKEEQEAPKMSQQEVPKMSPQEFRLYNRMAERMDMFVRLPPHTSLSNIRLTENHQHENFRHTYNLLHSACVSGKRPQGMSIRSFLNVGEEFCHHLTIHHTFEEQHIFPVLARKMPAFKKELQLLTQHKQIHEGLEKFESYLRECRSGERELRLEEMREVMEGFGKVLWEHLDEEVKELRAENMRKYWSVEEMRRWPM